MLRVFNTLLSATEMMNRVQLASCATERHASGAVRSSVEPPWIFRRPSAASVCSVAVLRMLSVPPPSIVSVCAPMTREPVSWVTVTSGLMVRVTLAVTFVFSVQSVFSVMVSLAPRSRA